MRWLPKKNGLRPVVRQPKHVKEKSKRLLRFLTALRAINGERLGFSVPTRTALHDRLIEFCRKETEEPLFYLSADVRNCFESIPFEGLEKALREFAPPDTQFSSVMVTTGRRRRPVVFVRNDLLSLVEQLPAGAQSRPVVAVAASARLTHERLSYGQVTDEVMRIVRAGAYRLNPKSTTTWEIFKVSSRGLPQGSSFSSILVDIYFGALDAQVRKQLCSNTMGVRLVDDLLCLSHSMSDIEKIRSEVLTNNTYGEINEAKFECGQLVDGQEVKWAGFVLRPAKGRMNVSAGSNSGVQRPRVSLGKRRSVSLTQLLGSSLGRSLAQHCLPLLLDRRLNSLRCVNENAYRAGALAGRRVRQVALSGGVATDIREFLRKLSSFAKRRLANDKSLFRQFRLGLEHSL